LFSGESGEETFRFQCCPAAGSGGGYRLSEKRFLDISGGKDSRNIGRGAFSGRNDESFFIEFQLTGEQCGIGNMAYCYKQSGTV
jgi:hypothetical protein